MPDSEGVSAPPDILAPRPSVIRRAVSALLSPLRNRRRRLPPQDDYLRRDIGIEEREMPREYWEYWWHHR
ncbi:hypothetical protein [Mesorhizobium captivum]|uniref:hypothetical protein n=1 Tax=Mesorhizobium captivum TaxID=3072319 RepID=UPI002A23BD39|nr:hypothetical protein [Mesorhizobium sp. VK3C]MDX8445770.1 hypothetical protein [Mesorhizobium sp. VK3C]